MVCAAVASATITSQMSTTLQTETPMSRSWRLWPALLVLLQGWSHGCGSGPGGATCPAALFPPVQAPARAEAKPAPLSGGDVLIRGATVWTAAREVLEETDVLVQKGRITRVGVGLKAPDGVFVVDGTKAHLTPGLIDPHSHLGVYPLPSLRGTADGNEWAAKPLTAQVRAEDAYWPQDPAIPRALAAGVTTAQILPGSSNLVGGWGVTVRLIPGRTVDEVRFPGAPTGLKMACGENPKYGYGKKGGPFSRMGNVAWMRAAFQAAVEYRRKWRQHRAKVAAWRDKRTRACDKGKGHEHAVAPLPPERDLQLETLVRVMEGKVRVHWHCYRADDMAATMRVAEEFGFKVAAFHHASEAYKIRDLLAKHGAAAVTWINWWGFKAEATDAIPEGVALLHQAGVVATMHSDSSRVIQRLNHEGALAYYRGVQAKIGLEPHDAVKFVTINAARVLGIQDQVGSIEVGKLGDLVLWDRAPLSVYARPTRVFVAGRLMFDRSKAPRPSDFELRVPVKPSLGKPPLRLPPAPLKPTAGEGAARATLAVINATPFFPTQDSAKPVTVLIAGDRVVGLGPGLKPPAGARVIDAAGLVLTPGLIASETRLGLAEISMEPSASERVRGAGPVRAALDVATAINPRSWAVPVTRIEGVVTAVVRPAGGLVAGRYAAFDLMGQSPAENGLRTPLAVRANLGLAGARAMGGSRARALMRLKELLDDARALLKAGKAVEARRYRKLSATVTQLRALAPVLKREIPLVVSVDRASDIRAALKFAKEQKVRLVINGGAEAWRVAGEVAKANVPVLVNPDLNAPESFDKLQARYDNAAILASRGVTVAFSAVGDIHNIRSIRQMAGIAVARGLPRRAALQALTVNPARIFGLKDRGSLAVGQRANLVLWDGDLFELKTRARHVIIGGKQVPLVSRQTLLRDRYLKLPQK